MLKLVKRLIWNSSLDSAFLKHNAHVSVCECTCKLHFIFCICKILIFVCKGSKKMQSACSSSLIYSSERPTLPVILGNEERNSFRPDLWRWSHFAGVEGRQRQTSTAFAQHWKCKETALLTTSLWGIIFHEYRGCWILKKIHIFPHAKLGSKFPG